MSFGLGMIHARSSKQKLNTKSSTESEIVGLSEYIPYNIWINNFMEAQGYDLKSHIVYQDNQSAIRMEVNGRNSCTGNSRHIDIRYFFVKDRVDKQEVQILYCPTNLMIADFFTKPLQGSLFKVFREVIMGYKPITALLNLDTIKERVENTVFVQNSNESKQNGDSDVGDKKSTKSESNFKRTYLQAAKRVKWKE